MIWIIITHGLALAVGLSWGLIIPAILVRVNQADEYDPIQYPPEPRVMPQIWDGFNRKEIR